MPFMGGSDEFEFVGDRLYLFDESRDARTSMFAGFGMEIVTDQESDGEIEPLTISCWRITLPHGRRWVGGRTRRPVAIPAAGRGFTIVQHPRLRLRKPVRFPPEPANQES